jgi:L-asparagine transporter-like permease|tara:strand:- start:767 stop:949 length:183 start_codon:yes stop_codon:yes gene_type:complete
MCIIAMIVLFYIVSYLVIITFIEYKDTQHQNKKLKENMNKKHITRTGALQNDRKYDKQNT